VIAQPVLDALLFGVLADPPNPAPAAPPGLESLGSTFLAWTKWILIICGVGGLMICGIMMAVGRRNRSSFAADGAAGIPGCSAADSGRSLRSSSAPCCPGDAAMTIDVRTASRRRSRRRAAIIGTTVAVLAAMITAGWVLLGRHRAPPGRHRMPPQPATRSTATPPPPTPATGGATAADVLPSDLRWVQAAGVWLPVSATAGPADVTGGLARRFAHSPAGAVLAAVHLLVRTPRRSGCRSSARRWTTRWWARMLPRCGNRSSRRIGHCSTGRTWSTGSRWAG
jgi:hypothetical protein